VSITLNEYTTIKDIAELIEIFAILKDKAPEDEDVAYLDSHFYARPFRNMPKELKRQTEFMQ